MEYTPAKIKDILVEFLKTFKDLRNELKYRTLISQLPSRGGVSIVIDYPDMLSYNTEIATNLVKEPDLYLKAFDEAAVEALAIEDPVYSDKVRKEIHVRIRELTDPISLRDVAKLQLNTLIMVRGMVVRSSELRPLAVVAAFRCTNQHVTLIEQSGIVLKRPVKCETEGCGENKSFELDELKTEFIDFQIIRIQELPEELPPGQLPQTFDVHLVGDVVNSARPGDRIVLTGIVKAESEFSAGAGKLRLFTYRIEGNFVDQLGKSPEETEITREEEEQIKTLASLPGAYDRLIASVAPAIYGHEIHKEAALLLMVGSKQKTLPDGSTLRGDINCLLVGDPGCLVSDERIILGNGAIAKIGQLGTHHLEKIRVELQTGDSNEKAIATTFHKYANQQIIEILTESGKSLKGTLNHPLLARKREQRSRTNEWRRLDEVRIGDMVSVASYIPCTIKELARTNFKRIPGSPRTSSTAECKLPSRMTKDLAAFCGYINAGGWVRKFREQITFVVSEEDSDILSSLVAMSTSLFGIEPEIKRILHGRAEMSDYVTIRNRDLSYNLAFLNEKRIPGAVLMSPNEISASYLRWLYETSGHAQTFLNGSGIISFENNNIELLRDIQILLLRFGIHSRIAKRRLEIRRASSILKFCRRIGFASIRKRSALAVLAKLAGSKVIGKEQSIERVARIARHPDADVYDVEIPGIHRFIANGIISHNTAKSELLKYVARVAPRALYTSGRGTTAAGLTAAVVREKNGMLMLEAGATVLADLGIAIIDEFDKMRKDDRDALHEVMEQQSYHPSVEISFADGSRIPIGPYVERLLDENRSSVVFGKNCEVLPLADKGIEFYTCNLPNAGLHRARLDRVSKHKAPEKFVTLKFSNGRSITVTPEHPVYVYRCNSVSTLRADEVTDRDYVPAPRLVPNSSAPVLLTKRESNSNSIGKRLTFPNNLTPGLARLLGFLVSEGHSYAGRAFEIGFSNTNEELLRQVRKLFQEIFEVSPTLHRTKGVTTQRYISVRLFNWFTENFGELMHHARERRVPRKILGSSVYMIREFLSSAFLGDGSVESTSICYRTASPGLAEDYSDLLHKLGIFTRLVHDEWNDSFKVYIMGDSIPNFVERVVERYDMRISRLSDFSRKSVSVLRGHDTLPPQVAKEIASLMKNLGITHSNYFYEHIKHQFGVNRTIVENYLSEIDERITKFEEFSRTNWSTLRGARKKLGISQQLLANIWKNKRGTVAYLETNGYQQSSRESKIASLRSSVEDYSSALKSETLRIRELLEFRFLRVAEVKVVTNRGSLKTDWVYDVTIEPTQNFVSKGVILHNTASVAKGGFIATLNARTSILAAANPVFGKYDPYKNILDNVNLPVPLLTRFDLVFIVKDEPDAARDEILAKHVLDMHAKLTFPRTPPIEFNMLKKYIIYAKKLDPELTEEARKRLSDYYIDLRRLAQPGQIAVTPRWLEGLVRLSIARARVLLHSRVTEDDALRAVGLMKRMLETVAVDQNTSAKQVDVGVLYGKPLSERNLLETALESFKKLEGEGPSKQPVEDKAFTDELVKTGKFNGEDAEKMLKTLYRSGQIYEIKPHFYRRI